MGTTNGDAGATGFGRKRVLRFLASDLVRTALGGSGFITHQYQKVNTVAPYPCQGRYLTSPLYNIS